MNPRPGLAPARTSSRLRDEVDEVVAEARRSLDETLGALARGGVRTAGAPAGAHG